MASFNHQRYIDTLLAASAGCILDLRSQLADYVAADPDVPEELQAKTASKCKLAGNLASLLEELISPEWTGKV
jgi:hypothetical protein